MKNPAQFPMNNPETMTRDTETATHYVGIGASAGGLEALEAFFTNMPPASGLAFVVVQHLSPDYKSLMVELLSKKTSMPVHRAEDGMPVLPDNVYLIPPKKNLSIFHGKLLLSEPDTSRGINLPIDVFLRSLAPDQGEKSIAIILSGTGSDGVRGIRAIKEHGGSVMVQDEESAKFDGMPRAAIATGLADFILPPDRMPAQLLAFTKHPYAVKGERSETLLSDEEGLTRIFALLRERCKVDFTYYKPSTVTRRIERRMTINQTEELKDYVVRLMHHPAEVNALYRELLIGVTSFFRDQEAFDYIADSVMPEILRKAGKREIRFWAAGCSTGEEAYSLAILARECMEAAGIHQDVKIFATDIDRNAIHFAANGLYPESIAADISPRLLAKYFHKRDDNFQIVRSIREMVVFAQHNLIKDPPFTNIDLISCRNLLIYLQPVLQRKVMESFNFSLPEGGFLVLGTSETTGELSDFFDPVESKLKIYRSRGRVKSLGELHFLSVTDTRYRERKGYFASTRRNLVRAADDERVLERLTSSLAGDFFPLAVIVNDQMEVVQVIGESEGYFRIPSGKLVNDVSKMAVKELSIPLSTGIQKAFRNRSEVRFSNIRVNLPGGAKLVDLRIRPLPQKKDQEALAVIYFGEVKRVEAPGQTSGAAASYDVSKETEERLRDLEQELQFTRENLQATIEELETSNEELQATNEELLASNEELQSTNEELQSTNEELYTVNTEYQSKIIELTELHNDVENLLGATLIGTLLLDENLEVRRFSKRIVEIFHLLDSDVGRPITHISHFLNDIDPLDAVREVQSTNLPVEREVRTRDGAWHLMRVAPYAVGPRAFSGTVISFINISGIKNAEAALRASEELFSCVVNNSPSAVWTSGTDKKCSWFNETWLSFTGRTLEQEQGDGWAEGVHPEDLERCFDIYNRSFDSRTSFAMEYRLRHRDGTYRWILDEGRPRYADDGTFLGYVGWCTDITRTKELEEALAAAEKRIGKLEEVREKSGGTP